jgi:hypothetical protein
VEVNHVRERERAFAVRRAAEPGTSPAQGKDQRTDGGGMKAGLLMKSRRTLPNGETKEGEFAVSSVWQKRSEGWRVIYSHESTTH